MTIRQTLRWGLFAALLATYGASWYLPIFELPPRPPGLNHMDMTPNGGIWPGYACFLFGLFLYGYSLLPNLSFIAGLILFARGRDRASAILGTIALVSGALSYLLLRTTVASIMIGYAAWLGSFLLLSLSGVALYIYAERSPCDPKSSLDEDGPG